mmetsp:Transcript_25970/g.36604  ORF Transcript_25970/g.36604 Transcript_25970/m.36604 type:complete len:80 (+) Transcript_25970:115-354(+)
MSLLSHSLLSSPFYFVKTHTSIEMLTHLNTVSTTTALISFIYPFPVHQTTRGRKDLPNQSSSPPSTNPPITGMLPKNAT